MSDADVPCSLCSLIAYEKQPLKADFAPRSRLVFSRYIN